MKTDDIGATLAIVSLALGIFGFFYLALWVGPPAIVCGVAAFYRWYKYKELTDAFKIMALIGTILGLYEAVFAILGLAGVI
jgi:hypothetical protein